MAARLVVEFEFDNGDKVISKVTGFKGEIICAALWNNGCLQYCVKPRVSKKDNKQNEGHWFDQIELKLTKAGKALNEQKEGGGPQADAPVA